jgi:hypothetical protein
MAGSVKQEDCGPGWPGEKMRPYLKNNQGGKGYKLGSSGSVLAGKHGALSSNSNTVPTPHTKRTCSNIATMFSELKHREYNTE